MNDTMVTLVGNAATAVEHRLTTGGVTVARFRLAATSRRWDKAQERWTDGETSFYTVRSWRGLADNVAASVAVGEPLVVQGRLRLREGEQPPERGGQRWFAAEVDAVVIGHDLSRGTAAFRRATRAARTGGGGAPPGGDVAPQPQPQPVPTQTLTQTPTQKQKQTQAQAQTEALPPTGRPERASQAGTLALGGVTNAVRDPVPDEVGGGQPDRGSRVRSNSPQKASVP
ncbi:single-stranded DNA-binding protein [Streptomyces sp. NPDC048506]|uniref:single-stranded DNA-binding protein n=1 Tax=Streptomyces sp. NPDC048506 TaxID=3155028 RepID=UPI003434B15A